MFSSTYQNGEYGVEIFSPSGNDPFKACKLNNEGNIKKLYDRSIKGYMLALEKESASTSLQFPKSTKGSLGITQPLLVLQLQLHPEKAFSLEMIVVDSDRQRRRFHLSTNFKDIDVNSLHVCIPWIQPDREQWSNVAINLEELLGQYSAGKSFGSLESFTIQPVCRIRKIFSLPLKYLGDEMTGNNIFFFILSKFLCTVTVYCFPTCVWLVLIVLFYRPDDPTQTRLHLRSGGDQLGLLFPGRIESPAGRRPRSFQNPDLSPGEGRKT